MLNRDKKNWKARLIAYFAVPALLILTACTKENLDPYEYPENSVEIKELILNCKDTNQLAQQAFFWSNQMGFQKLSENKTSFSVQAGNSKLTFKTGQFGGNYHFSLDIPENQIEKARNWILKRAKIVPEAGTGAEVLHKSRLNVHSLFFRDPAGNLIELTARHELNNPIAGDFSKDLISGISNITIVTRNIQDCKDLLFNSFQLSELPGTTNSVKIVGGRSGTITLHIPTRAYYPTEDIIAFSYRLTVVVRHPSEQIFKFPGSEATIRSEP